jgi:RNA polymerase sigma-70 factor, ECF subfamily
MAVALPTIAEALSGTVSFTELVETHQAMVFSIAYHFLHDRATAEEIAQDVLLELYSHQHELRSNQHVVFWLRKVTVNQCIDQSRRVQRRAETPIDAMDDLAAPSRDDDQWMNRRLRQLVASLPEKARMVVVLRYQEDLEPAEIAKLLKLPVNTVKSHLQRALVLLRQKAGVGRS